MHQKTINNTISTNNILENSLTLPCGAVLKNRIAKAAVSDSLGNGEGDPTENQIRLYEKWAQGGTSLSIMGEVQGSPFFPEKPGNLVLTDQSDFNAIRSLTERAAIEGSHIWAQLGHAGALSHIPISHPKGPSRLSIGDFQCEGMSIDEIRKLPELYARTAVHAKSAGFTGIHIHAGHGFLLSQFLSPLFNQRSDSYGGSIVNRSRIVLEVINKVRKAVGQSFPVGIKINSTDKLENGLSETDALELVKLLDQTSIDLIDISGGTYFPGAKASSESSSKEGPYFLRFAKLAKDLTDIPIMLSGGFHKREHAVDALESGFADIVSSARAMILNPQLANTWMSEEGGDPVFPKFTSPPQGSVTAWYSMRMTALGEDNEKTFNLDPQSALDIYNERDDQRCIKWRNRFYDQHTES